MIVKKIIQTAITWCSRWCFCFWFLRLLIRFKWKSFSWIIIKSVP